MKQQQLLKYSSIVPDGNIVLASLLLPGCSNQVLVAREAERHTDHGSAAEVLDLFEPVAGATGLLTCNTTSVATALQTPGLQNPKELLAAIELQASLQTFPVLELPKPSKLPLLQIPRLCRPRRRCIKP